MPKDDTSAGAGSAADGIAKPPRSGPLPLYFRFIITFHHHQQQKQLIQHLRLLRFFKALGLPCHTIASSPSSLRHHVLPLARRHAASLPFHTLSLSILSVSSSSSRWLQPLIS